jgi:hypothetical protein
MRAAIYVHHGPCTAFSPVGGNRFGPGGQGPQYIGWLPGLSSPAIPEPMPSTMASYHERSLWCCRQLDDDCHGQPSGGASPRARHSALGKPTGNSRDTHPTVPGFPALLRRMGVSITMYISKPEPPIEELLSDPVMVTVLQHSRTTPDDLRGLMRDARERLAKATAAEASDHASKGALS